MEKTKSMSERVSSFVKEQKESNTDNTVLHSKQENKGKQGLQVPSVKAGLGKEWTRSTFIVRDEYLEKIKALAYWDRKKNKDILDEALTEYFTGKKVKSIPKK